ncbi:MAG: holin family protein [Oscillospiraceae bacterium]
MSHDFLKGTLTTISAIIGYLFGRFDGLMYSLLAVICIDYITGVICAIIKKELNSEVGFKGILKKVFILIIVSVSNIIDVNLLSNSRVLYSSVIAFYLVNESISILENASLIGIPLPNRLKSVLKQLSDKNSK